MKMTELPVQNMQLFQLLLHVARGDGVFVRDPLFQIGKHLIRQLMASVCHYSAAPSSGSPVC